MIQTIGAIALLVVGVAGAAQIVLRNRFSQRLDGYRRDLLATQVLSDAPELPPMVRAFAERNGGHHDGSRAMRMQQKVLMRLTPGATLFPLTATQDSGTRNPGFVWEAWGRMAVVVPLWVVDSYVGGAGLLEVRLAGVVPVAKGAGAEVDKGEAMRFLAELPWNPDAILTASGLDWRQTGDRTVDVSMDTKGGRATVTLGFDAAGDIVASSASDRPRGVGQASVPTEWIGRISSYISAGGYRWPHRAEVAWVLPEGEFVYWQGEIVSLTAVPN